MFDFFNDLSDLFNSGILGVLIAFAIIIWGLLWFFLPFFVWGIHENLKKVNDTLNEINSKREDE